MEPPAGRTKRAAASKAEGFFRALASSGGSASGESEGDSEGRKSNKGLPADDCTAGTSDSPSSEASRGRASGGPSVEGSGSSSGSSGGRQAQQQTKRKSGAGGGGRGAKEKGKVKTTGDRPLKSAGRNSSGGGGSQPRGQPGMKPRPTATTASMGKLLGRLGEWGPKVRVPANPAFDDVWKATDHVLRNLPDTSALTVDALVGGLPRQWRTGPTLSIGDGGRGSTARDADGGGSASPQRVRKRTELVEG